MSCFYLLIFYFEKFLTWIWRLPFVVYVKLKLFGVTFTTNISLKLRNSQNRKWAYKNSSQQFLWIKLAWRNHWFLLVEVANSEQQVKVKPIWEQKSPATRALSVFTARMPAKLTQVQLRRRAGGKDLRCFLLTAALFPHMSELYRRQYRRLRRRYFGGIWDQVSVSTAGVPSKLTRVRLRRHASGKDLLICRSSIAGSTHGRVAGTSEAYENQA